MRSCDEMRWGDELGKKGETTMLTVRPTWFLNFKSGQFMPSLTVHADLNSCHFSNLFIRFALLTASAAMVHADLDSYHF